MKYFVVEKQTKSGENQYSADLLLASEAAELGYTDGYTNPSAEPSIWVSGFERLDYALDEVVSVYSNNLDYDDEETSDFSDAQEEAIRSYYLRRIVWREIEADGGLKDEPLVIPVREKKKSRKEAAKEAAKEASEARAKDIPADGAFWTRTKGLHPDSKKRLETARKAPCTPKEVNHETYTGYFSGSSGQYVTTLNDCECRDYFVHKNPCKHMWRLAIELGLLDMSAVSDASKVKTKKKPTQL